MEWHFPHWQLQFVHSAAIAAEARAVALTLARASVPNMLIKAPFNIAASLD
jgi:hypothetical protein